jgi:hypothetical protein
MFRRAGARLFLLLQLLLLALSPARIAHAQACCAGSSAVTPARLALHEDALVGTTLHVGGVLGSYAVNGAYSPQGPGSTEVDVEEDLLLAVRLTKRAQLAALIPLVETFRSGLGASAHSGGVGDINLGARYDFVLARESRYIPGVAVLLGATFPTGRPPEEAQAPLAVDATGIGAFQGNVGLALEQTLCAWLVNLSGILAQRAARNALGVDETLGTQLTGIGAVAYTFRSEAALGLVGSYAAEGNATINGSPAEGSHKRGLTLSGVMLYPLTDTVRVQGSVFVMPPVSSVGANEPATLGATLTILMGIS